MQQINIAEAADENYFIGLMVSTYSIARHARKDVELVFHILDGGISDSSLKLLKCALAAAHPHVTVIRHCVDGNSKFESLGQWHGSKMTYARLVLPEILSEVDFVIYVDCDTLWIGDVWEMWQYRDPSAPILGVWDAFGAESEAAWFATRGLPFSRATYFNAGNVLINLRLFREEDLSRRVMDVLLAHKDVQYADQSGLNAVLGSRVKLLPPRFNVITRDLDGKPFDGAVVLHYAAQPPWKRTSWLELISPPVGAWFRELARIPGSTPSVIYRRYEFARRLGVVFALPRLLRFRIVRYPVFALLSVLRASKIRLLLCYALGHYNEVVESN